MKIIAIFKKCIAYKTILINGSSSKMFNDVYMFRVPQLSHNLNRLLKAALEKLTHPERALCLECRRISKCTFVITQLSATVTNCSRLG